MNNLIQQHGPSALWVSAILVSVFLVSGSDHKIKDALSKQCIGACYNEKIASSNLNSQKTTP